MKTQFFIFLGFLYTTLFNETWPWKNAPLNNKELDTMSGQKAKEEPKQKAGRPSKGFYIQTKGGAPKQGALYDRWWCLNSLHKNFQRLQPNSKIAWALICHGSHWWLPHSYHCSPSTLLHFTIKIIHLVLLQCIVDMETSFWDWDFGWVGSLHDYTLFVIFCRAKIWFQETTTYISWLMIFLILSSHLRDRRSNSSLIKCART